MLNRGFGTSLFNMVPKGEQASIIVTDSFETSLFNILSKGTYFSNP